MAARINRRRERGQVTAEYAVGTLGAVTIAGVLVNPIQPWLFRHVVRPTFEAALRVRTLPELFGGWW